MKSEGIGNRLTSDVEESNSFTPKKPKSQKLLLTGTLDAFISPTKEASVNVADVDDAVIAARLSRQFPEVSFYAFIFLVPTI